MTYQKMLYPILSFVSTIIILVVTFASKDIVFAIALLIAWVILLVPILSFLYSRVYLKEGKNKFLWTLLNSLSIVLPYLILFCTEGETYLYALILFAWSELWALLGLPRKRSPK